MNELIHILDHPISSSLIHVVISSTIQLLNTRSCSRAVAAALYSGSSSIRVSLLVILAAANVHSITVRVDNWIVCSWQLARYGVPGALEKTRPATVSSLELCSPLILQADGTGGGVASSSACYFHS
jgi:hypothetical protein